MGDIYHSEMVVVGAPSAETAFVSQNQEAYFRSIKKVTMLGRLQNLQERKQFT